MWLNDYLIFEMVTKLSGVIFKKALIEDDFEKVYKRAFRQILNAKDEANILEILGDIGG
jgi:hypothetical protein